MLARTKLGVKGITAHAASAGKIDNTGAKMNKNLLDLVGMMISLVNSFNASAIGCNKPFGPTRFGPIRICI